MASSPSCEGPGLRRRPADREEELDPVGLAGLEILDGDDRSLERREGVLGGRSGTRGFGSHDCRPDDRVGGRERERRKHVMRGERRVPLAVGGERGRDGSMDRSPTIRRAPFVEGVAYERM